MKKRLAFLLAVCLAMGPGPSLAAGALSIGDTGDSVRTLQARLAQLLYYAGPVSGVYDAGTAAGRR